MYIWKCGRFFVLIDKVSRLVLMKLPWWKGKRRFVAILYPGVNKLCSAKIQNIPTPHIKLFSAFVRKFLPIVRGVRIFLGVRMFLWGRGSFQFSLVVGEQLLLYSVWRKTMVSDVNKQVASSFMEN